MNTPPNREVALFSAALELPASERAAYLDEACAEDPALRRRLDELLRVHDEAIPFLENPAPGAQQFPVGAEVADATVRLSDSPAEKPGDSIGRYKLLEQIGEGGCGVVYVAEQREPLRRRVALKVIKLGMDTKQVIARFDAERQALALMDHPNIAKVLEAGATETGRPYFVMELVRGIKITDYCDRNNLSTEERLGLFIQVCRAIQHAHQKGIIHRDIKPSNILVTLNDGVPVPKVIDFGIAKATQGKLTDQTIYTAFEQFVGTPAYMSPEQAELTSLDIDTRSDIYSLGVLLYELLTGKTPFETKELLEAGLEAMRRTIREQEPVRPSTRLSTMLQAELTATAKHRHTDPPKLIHLLRGDLDWIVMKCLEKDRARRYETANGLASDIQRHLNCEPVVARPPSRLYEFQKSVRRHKFGFAAAAALIIVLALGVLVSTREAIRATRAEREQARLRLQAEQARTRAEAGEKKAATEAARSEQVANLMKGMLQGVGPSVALGRDTRMLREILDQTAGRLNDLRGQPAVEAELRATLGRVYADLGEYTNAAAMHQKALALCRTLYGNEHSVVAQSLNDLAEAIYQEGNYAEAEALHRQALAMRRKLFGGENLEVAQSLNNLAETLRKQGIGEQQKLAAAEPLHREALATRRKLLGNEHWDVAESLYNLGSLLWRQGRYPEAESAHREALAIRRKLLGAEHPQVAASLDRLGLLLDTEGRRDDAEVVHREALAMRRKLLGNDHPDVAHSLRNLALVLVAQGRLEEAETALKEALAIRWARLPADHTDISQTLESLVNLLRRENKLAEIETLYREQVKLLQQRLGDDHPAVARAWNALVNALMAEKKFAEAASLRRQELERRQNALGNHHPAVATAVIDLGKVLIAEGKVAEAEKLLSEELESRNGQSSNEDSIVAFELGRAEHGFGRTARDSGNLEVAERVFRLAVPALERAVAFSPTQAQYRVELSSAYLDLHLASSSDLENIRKAIATLNRALDDFPTQRRLFLEPQAHNYRYLGFRSQLLGKYPAAREAFTTATRFFRESAQNPARKAFCLQGEADDFQMVGDLWTAEGRTAEAQDAYRQSLAVHELIEEQDLAKQIKAGWAANHYTQLDQILAKVGTPEDALSIARVMRPVDSKTAAAVLAALANCRFRLADVLRKGGKLDEATAQVAKAEEITANAVKAVEEQLAANPSREQKAAIGLACLEFAQCASSGGRPGTAEPAVRKAIDVFKQLTQENPKNKDYRIHLGHSQWQLGDTLVALGRRDEAEQALREALLVFANAVTTFPGEAFLHQEHGFSAWKLATLLEGVGKLDEAEAEYRHAVALHEKASADFPDQTVFPERLGTFTLRLAELLRGRGRLAESGALAREAAQKYRTAMTQYEKLAAYPNECWGFAISYEALGVRLKELGQTQEAETAYRDAQTLWRKLVADFTTEDYRFHLAVNHDALANLLRETGRKSESLESYRSAQAIWLTLVAEFNVEDRRVHLGWTDEAIGGLLSEAKRFDEATEAYRQALEVWKKLVADFNKDDYRNHLSGTLANLSQTLRNQGKDAEAEALEREAADRGDVLVQNDIAWRLATDPDPRNRNGSDAVVYAQKAVAATSRRNLSFLDTLAAAYAETGQFAKAISIQQEATALSQSEPEKKDLASRLNLYRSNLPYRDHGRLADMVRALLESGKYVEAEPLARECLALREKQIPDDWRAFNARSMLGGALLGQKKYGEETEVMLLNGYEGMKQRENTIPPAGRPRLKEALQRLVQLYAETNRPDQAAEWKQKLAEFNKAET